MLWAVLRSSRSSMCCLKANQKLTCPRLFVSGALCTWEFPDVVEGRESIVYTVVNLSQTHTFYQPRMAIYQGRQKLQCFSFFFSLIPPVLPHHLTLFPFFFLKSGRRESPSASKLQLPPHLLKAARWCSDARTCLQSIGCCCSWAPLDGLFKRLHMLAEG